jgi:hypothetical protein
MFQLSIYRATVAQPTLLLGGIDLEKMKSSRGDRQTARKAGSHRTALSSSTLSNLVGVGSRR